MESKNYIITFPQTHSMIKAEKTLREQNISLRSMPLPASLGNNCGFCIRLKEKDLNKALNILNLTNTKGTDVYEITVLDGKISYVKAESKT